MVNCCPMELCYNATLWGFSSHCSNILRGGLMLLVQDGLYPCFWQQNERKEKEDKDYIHLLKNFPQKLPQNLSFSPMARVYDFHMPTAIWKGSWELHSVCGKLWVTIRGEKWEQIRKWKWNEVAIMRMKTKEKRFQNWECFALFFLDYTWIHRLTGNLNFCVKYTSAQ